MPGQVTSTTRSQRGTSGGVRAQAAHTHRLKSATSDPDGDDPHVVRTVACRSWAPEIRMQRRRLCAGRRYGSLM